MWDWSGTKTPPPVRPRGDAALEAQNQGSTPLRRDVRPVPIYRDARAFKTLPPTAPASVYPDPLMIPQPQQPYAPQPQPYAPQPQPYAPAPQPYAPQPQPYAPQPYAPQPQPYAPMPQQAYAPQPQPYAPQPQPYAPQPQPYAPQPYAPMPQQQAYAGMPASPTGNPDADRSLWEWQFSQMDLPNMELIEVNYTMLDANWLSELRKAFKRTRRDFLKYVGYHHINELIAAGMDEEAIKLVKKGKAPENFNVHVRVPFDYGGTNSFSNLVLIQTHPYHNEIHRFIDMQTLIQPNLKPMKLFLPSPKGKVYTPGEIEISSGGSSRHDRSVYAGFLESTFEMIAERSMMGR